VERLPSRRKRKGEPPSSETSDALPPSASHPAPAAEPLHGVRPFINLCGDYRFLRAGYWALVDAELNGVEPSPAPVQAVTAQNAAACLLVARHNGIETVEWKVARRPEDVEPPCLLVPVAGLTEKAYEVKSARSRIHQWRSATQNGTRAALAVKLNGELRSMRMVVGVAAHDDYHLAWDVWRTFGIPLCEIWFLETPAIAAKPANPLDPADPADRADSAVQDSDEVPPKRLFLGMDPLPLHELSERELRLYEEVSQRPMSR